MRSSRRGAAALAASAIVLSTAGLVTQSVSAAPPTAPSGGSATSPASDTTGDSAAASTAASTALIREVLRQTAVQPWGEAGAASTFAEAAAPTADPTADPTGAPTATPAPTGTTTATPTPAPSPTTQVPDLPKGWVETPVTFTTGLGTFYGSYAHPVDPPWDMPAALIVGGSGPGDRDGNEPKHGYPTMNSLRTTAHWLAQDGVASFRYDKLGSGQTGDGAIPPERADNVDVQDYLTINAQALATLGRQPGVDGKRISVVGHSEGGLFALLLAAGQHGTVADVPPVHEVAAVEGLSLPFLDVIKIQLDEQFNALIAAGKIPPEIGAVYLAGIDEAIAAVRAGRPIPPEVPADLVATIFPPDAQTYLRTIDAIDPRVVAASLPRRTQLLLTCSDADIQVTCGQVQQVADAARRAHVQERLVNLRDANHMFKVDTSRTPLHYNDDLPFSPRLRRALADWALSDTD